MASVPQSREQMDRILKSGDSREDGEGKTNTGGSSELSKEVCVWDACFSWMASLLSSHEYELSHLEL